MSVMSRACSEIAHALLHKADCLLPLGMRRLA